MQGNASNFELEHRNSVWSANREGLVSSVGYCCIHMFGVAIGRLIYSYALDFSNVSTQLESVSQSKLVVNTNKTGIECSKRTSSRNVAVKLPFLAYLAILSNVTFLAYAMLDNIGPVHAASRRVGNAGFVYWTVWHLMILYEYLQAKCCAMHIKFILFISLLQWH